jgi:hypothetical protein
MAADQHPVFCRVCGDELTERNRADFHPDALCVHCEVEHADDAGLGLELGFEQAIDERDRKAGA